MRFKADERRFGMGLLTHTLEYSTRKELELPLAEKTSVGLNYFYLHAWILQKRIKELSPIISSRPDKFLTSLRVLVREDNAYLFSTEYDEHVHEELKRQQRVLFRSLEDFFVYENTLKRDFSDIIYLDILN